MADPSTEPVPSSHPTRDHSILRANLDSFFGDGSASCAFVYLANDQDWALVHPMRLGLGRA